MHGVITKVGRYHYEIRSDELPDSVITLSAFDVLREGTHVDFELHDLEHVSVNGLPMAKNVSASIVGR